MNFGFNSNVRVGGAVYHVQTEDRGPSHPFLDTVVYETGRVVYKKSTNYEDFAASVSVEKDRTQQLHDWLARQHREVIALLETGSLPFQEQSKAPPEEQGPGANDGLDVRLTNPTSWFASGSVNLAIELRSKNSNREAGDAEVEAFLEQEKERIHCAVAQTDAKGRATLEFQMPATINDGASLVIRATDGTRYGELRFRLKTKPQGTLPAPVSK